MGGKDVQDTSNSEVWKSATGASWTQVTSNAGWQARTDMAGVTYNSNTLVLMGGISHVPFQEFNDIWTSTNGAAWTLLCQKPGWGVRSGMQALMLEDDMVMLGGSQTTDIRAGTLYNDMWTSGDGGSSWFLITGAAEWSGRTKFSALVFPPAATSPNSFRLWVIGGADVDGFVNDVYYFNPAAGTHFTQAQASANWEGRAGQAMSVANAQMVMTGGESQFGMISDAQGSSNAVMCYMYSQECTGHGTCLTGKCQCTTTSYAGPQCARPVCPLGCVHGTCDAPNHCLCDDGYQGTACDQTNSPTPSPPASHPHDPALTVTLVLLAGALTIGFVLWYCFFHGRQTQKQPQTGGAGLSLGSASSSGNERIYSAAPSKSHGVYNEL